MRTAQTLRSPRSLWVYAAVATLAIACSSSESSEFPPANADGGENGGATPAGSFDPGAPGARDGGNATADAADAAEIAVCGDGVIQSGEVCDDGNARPGDGCSGLCKIEPGYTCPKPGAACIYTVAMACGNGAIEGTEACDDGNVINLDGCSSSCQVEPGYSCATPGAPCTKDVVIVCGDGKVGSGEQCDDGNTSPGDGCNATCKLEAGYTCPTPGAACAKLVYCGDGVLQVATEQCDDGNAVPGDGCSGVCKLEAGYACPTAGVACVKIWVCGNGKVDPGEACDDSNTTSSDGCSLDCSLVEPGYTCPNVGGAGGPCTKAPANVCGDGILAGAEQCDDGNTNATDGCSAGCAVEAGYTCPAPGAACKKIAFCGDGKVDLDLGEACDDGAAVSGDGCTATCQTEPNYVCPTPGAPCVSTVTCGDGKVQGLETCDDGNSLSGDGCTAGNADPALSCQVEAGWTCSAPGARCAAKLCGDGILAGAEQCDDANLVPNDGCSAGCKLEPGFACTSVVGAKSVCTATVCGDGLPQGFEQCDDGNALPFDGCFNCRLEPSCAGGVCLASCGDGQRFVTEACDDGNTRDGDGCSATCAIEKGFGCTDVLGAPPTVINQPVLIRDFIGVGREAGGSTGHTDFNGLGGSGILGIVETQLDAGGKPALNCPGGNCLLNPGYLAGTGRHTNITTAANFAQWYANVPGVNIPSTITVPLARQADGTYTWDSANPAVNGGKNFFDPVSTGGWVALGKETLAPCGPSRNVSFTSETHFWFEYQGGERFDFAGDDDTWVFVNRTLAIDLGGLHTPRTGFFVLDADTDGAGPDTADGRATFSSDMPQSGTVNLGLVKGGVYEVVMFQAERNQCGSNFRITLKDFNRPKSTCASTCGDGVLASDEVCDDGVNDGSYGGCMPGCQARGPLCGDGLTQDPPEKCDDGANVTTYGGASATKCGPGCKFAPYCGDGVVSNGEQCDEAAGNGTGYGHCTAGCALGPRCGDGIKQAPTEECDSGVANGASGDKCSATCTLKCGNGLLEAGEQCDSGAANNVGGYGKCNPDCSLGPRCGDGFKNGAEPCDDGKNDGTYGTCNPGCTLASYCGDGALTNPPEVCDLGGANSSSAYGAASCSNRCTRAPYCGDKAVDGAFGETCDDGVNSGAPGSCAPDCKSFVPLVTCGNGIVQPPEQCDDGANNGTAADACDAHCRFKCGNGIKDPGETCDNGVNDGSYGGCTTNCQVAGYCGDGIKNGPEACDNGAGNVAIATAYGPGICTTACTFAPYCGDGRVQASFGEQCDSTASCDAACKNFVPK